jgi:transposase InsO family protein
VKPVADALSVARSNLIEQQKAQSEPCPPRQAPRDDEWLVERIRRIIDARGSYGYRRATALVSKELIAEGKAAVNHKRVYRVMRERQLLLARHTGKPRRVHDGVIITLKSNLRWCSDGFEIRCWNGERVNVAFSLDCCDREAMSFVATTGGISGEMIRDLMVSSLEHRFGAGAQRTPHPIEWLSDNGSCYTANETVAFGQVLGLIMCTTPVYSPESNGMAEAFVKSFKRDYVYLNPLETAESVMRMLPTWFDDYNEVRPHRGLKMRSPREYMRLLSTR